MASIVATLPCTVRKMATMNVFHSIAMASWLLAAAPCSAGHGTSAPAADGGLDQIKASILLAEKESRTEALLDGLRALRDLQAHAGALDSALRTGHRITNLNIVSQDRVAMAADWQALARIGTKAGSLSEAVSSAKRAVLILKTTGNTARTNTAMVKLMDLLLASGRNAEFKRMAEDALRNLERDGNPTGQAAVLCRQGKCLSMEGRPADALPLLHLALRHAERSGQPSLTALILFELARANTGLGQWEAAQRAFGHALRLDPGAPGHIPELYGLQARILEGNGDLRMALIAERQQALAKDSLFSATMALHVARMNRMYDFQAKNKEIEALREANRGAQLGLTAAQRKGRWVLFAAIGFALALLALLLLRAGQARWVRRTRMRNTVITSQAKEMQVKSSELERQNLRLAKALMEGGDELRIAGAHRDVDELALVELMLQCLPEAPAIGEKADRTTQIQRRVQAMALLNRNRSMEGGTAKLNLKAHFKAMASMLESQYGLLGNMDLALDLPDEDLPAEHLPTLSLFVHELLLISTEHASGTDLPTSVHLSLRRIGHHQFELLYTDDGGGINSQTLGNGSLCARMVQSLAEVLGGTILLLRGEQIALQLTYSPNMGGLLKLAS